MRNLVIEPMACPQGAVLTITEEELQSLCDSGWAENGRNFILKFGAKFRKEEGGDQPEARKYLEKEIGINRLYAKEISDFSVKVVQEATKQRVLFLVSTPRLANIPNSTDKNLFFSFYFSPEIKYEGPTEWELEYKPEFTLEKMLSNQVKAMRSRPFTGCLNSNCKFTLEIKANGKSDKTEYKSLDEIDYISLRDVLRTHRNDDEFTYSFNDDGVEREFEVKLSDVYYRDDAETDDDMAKAWGFETLEAMNLKAEENYNNIQNNRKKNLAVDHVINEIITKGQVDPIPSEFVRHHIKRVKEEQYKESDKVSTWKKFGVKNEEEFEEKIDQMIMQDIAQSMACRCYANLVGLETTDMDEIMNHMITRVNWV